jgi:uncharacterized protein
VSFYLDTSVLVSFFLGDVFSERVDTWLQSLGEPLIVSTWTRTEFAAVVLRKARNSEITLEHARTLQLELQEWSARQKELDITAECGRAAALLAADERLKLSAADCLHLAMSEIAKCTLVTNDQRLAKAARVRLQTVIVP